MAKRVMSAEGRAKIAAAAKKRWANFRKEQNEGGAPEATSKKRGRPAGKRGRKPGSKPGAKRGRRPGRPAGASKNPFLQMTISQLVQARAQIDEAWDAAQQAFAR